MEREVINNAFYDELGEKWYEGGDHPIALLRAENEARIPWVSQQLVHHFGAVKTRLLDLGCGAGLLANQLAREGHHVTGVDLSAPSLEIAKRHDTTHTVEYQMANLYDLPFAPASFDVITAMDVLEHIEDPSLAIKNVGRLLKPKGLFFFHTFNRTFLSWLFAVKGVSWCKNSPKDLHLYRLFIRPSELQHSLAEQQMEVVRMHGLAPIFNRAFLRLLLTREVHNGFRFRLTDSLRCGYLGYAIKK